ncbi:Uncharacterised protein [Chlamydia trachomatis]|nr:Uncharacterised protein [Chlamydia trachomatis]
MEILGIITTNINIPLHNTKIIFIIILFCFGLFIKAITPNTIKKIIDIIKLIFSLFNILPNKLITNSVISLFQYWSIAILDKTAKFKKAVFFLKINNKQNIINIKTMATII